MNNPFCLILSGPSGSGKSTTAKKLWQTIDGNPAYLSLDSIKHIIRGARSNDYFLDLARESALLLTENYLRLGHPTIVDKAFGSYRYVKPFVDLAKRLSLKSYYFKLNAPLNTLVERVEDRRKLSLEEKIQRGEWPLPVGNIDTATRIYEFFEKNKHPEGIEIDTEKNSPDQVIGEILSRIKGNFETPS
ncbi:MAG: ATP-binding protein [Nanoarchaeota archaeon]|nr:ATP-binding protein [Nanoarchaeota archaeon]